MNQRGNSARLYELLAKKEELKKVDDQIRVQFISQDIYRRRKKYLEDVERYRKMTEEMNERLKMTIEKPRFNLLLDSESVQRLIEDMRVHTKELIIEQRTQNKTLQAKRGNVKKDFTDFFQSKEEEKKKTYFVKSKNFDFNENQYHYEQDSDVYSWRK